ncbi:hypothetical protein [Stappia sp.]|uniref:hypothetical protein n=1 Tax=Stappia sp. TaxID=1870903 RepID=UPI0032D9A516
MSIDEFNEARYNYFKDMEIAAFEASAAYGRWVTGALFLIHGGALVGILSTLEGGQINSFELKNNVKTSIYFFTFGVIFAIGCGALGWRNYMMHSQNYSQRVRKYVLDGMKDPEDFLFHSKEKVNLTYRLAIFAGSISTLLFVFGCISLTCT